MRIALLFVFSVLSFVSPKSLAAPSMLRWTATEDRSSTLASAVDRVNRQFNSHLTTRDFYLAESRTLAFNKYQRYQLVAAGLPVLNRNIRIWSDSAGTLIQAEAYVDPRAPLTGNRFLRTRGLSVNEVSNLLPSTSTVAIVNEVLSQLEDNKIRGYESSDYWDGSEPIRRVVVTARRGKHVIDISLSTGFVKSTEYKEFPNAGTHSIRANVYPVYEEAVQNGVVTTRLQTEEKELKHIHTTRPVLGADPFAALRARRYFASQYSSVLGESQAGRARGFWSMSWLKSEAAQLIATAPTEANDFTTGSTVLVGRYATINLHPDAVSNWSSRLNFRPRLSGAFFPQYRAAPPVNGRPDYEIVPSTSFYGKPLATANESLARSSTRDPQHNPVTYINEGFDELQVYYAVTELFDRLHERGFIDPELSTRPFHAFLYDPDVAMKDNAYYTDDTINFTTYSHDQQNYARDNSTIWHEIGHGIMDRLMGEHLTMADTGGLSEGMADFIAELVLKASYGNRSFAGYSEFRIINRTNFHLSNEVHDDGEAYGGAMRDMLVACQAQFGDAAGLDKMTDLTLEAMRLTRDHPVLTAEAWFSAMIFADSLGRPGVRSAGEMTNLIQSALAGRNFRMDGGAVARFQLVNANDRREVGSSGPGSRGQPIAHSLTPAQNVSYRLQVRLTSSDRFQFAYPLQVKAEFKAGALQGAIDWEGEDGAPNVVTLARETDVAELNVRANGRCDFSNREDGSCVDYVYVQIIDPARPTQPLAKKRFYLRIRNP